MAVRRTAPPPPPAPGLRWLSRGPRKDSDALVKGDFRRNCPGMTDLSSGRQSSSHPHFDQPRSPFRHRFGKRRDEFIGRGHRAARNAHALGEPDEIERRAIERQHVLGARAGIGRADAVEFAVQDL